MADEKKMNAAKTDASAKKAKKDTAAKAAKSSKEKKPNVFVRMGRSIKKFFKELRGECKKVTWPDRKTVFKSTGIVIVSVAVIGLIIWLIDMGLSSGVGALVNLAKGTEAATEAATTAPATAGAILTNFFGI